MVRAPAECDREGMDKAQPARPRSTIVIPALVAFAAALGSALLAVIFGALANFNDISAVTAAHQRWLNAGPIGECGLAAAALALLALGLRLTAQRRNAAIAAKP
jgi:hypothetical protein